MSRKSLRSIAMLAALVLVLIACNVIAPLIDTPTMRKNAHQGTAMLSEQYAVPKMVGGFKSAQLDNFTTVLMIKTAAYTGPETWLQKAFGGFRTDMPVPENADMQAAWKSFCIYADGSESPTA